jgi:hypothetical protein
MQQSFRVLQQSGGSGVEHHQVAEDFSISGTKNHHQHHHKTTTATVVVDLLPPAYTSVLGHSHLQPPASSPQQAKMDCLKGEDPHTGTKPHEPSGRQWGLSLLSSWKLKLFLVFTKSSPSNVGAIPPRPHTSSCHAVKCRGNFHLRSNGSF